MSTASLSNHQRPRAFSGVRLGDICEVRLGKMLSPASKTGTRPVPYLRNANVQWNRFDLSDVATMDFSEQQEAVLALRPGDLLVCEGGEPGRAAVWEGQISRCCYQKALHRLRPRNDCVDPYFLMYFLWHAASFGKFTSANGKTTIAHLPAVRLRKLNIDLPDIAEQQRLVRRLRNDMEAIAQAREAASARLSAAAALPAAFVRDTLRTRTRKQHLGDCLIEVKSGVGPTWTKYAVLGATRGGVAPAKEPVGKNPERYKLVDPLTVFYNPMRILLGSIAIVDEGNPPGITSPDYVVVKGKPGVLHTRWFYYWFRSACGARLIESLTRGAVRERILFNRLAKGEIDLPDYDAQTAAAERMRAVLPMVQSITEEVEAFDALGPAVLREAFAGVRR